MQITLAETGLAVMIVAWAVQLVYVQTGRREISSALLLGYGLGLVLLVADSYTSQGLSLMGWLNLLILVPVLAILAKTHGKR
jgi:hypothetical protein